MEYHFDRKVMLSTEPEYQSLYRWFLREERERSPNLIPWRWTLYFDLTDIRLTSSLKIGDHDAEGNGKDTVTEKDSIVANLVPGRFRSTTYSMFGTDRPLLDFVLTIETAQDDAKESCHAWGYVSYTYELDFRYNTTPDVLNFTLYISKSRFARLAALVRDKAIDMASLRVGQVDGFYSEWSPKVSTDSIKVLPHGKDHPVEMPEGCKIEPPRLGHVGKFELFLSSMSKFNAPAESKSDDLPEVVEETPAELSDPVWGNPVPAVTLTDAAPDVEEEIPLEVQDHARDNPAPIVVPVVDAKMLGLLKSIRGAAWVIAALLLCLFVLKR